MPSFERDFLRQQEISGNVKAQCMAAVRGALKQMAPQYKMKKADVAGIGDAIETFVVNYRGGSGDNVRAIRAGVIDEVDRVFRHFTPDTYAMVETFKDGFFKQFGSAETKDAPHTLSAPRDEYDEIARELDKIRSSKSEMLDASKEALVELMNRRILSFDILKKVANSIRIAFDEYKAPSPETEKQQLTDLALHVVEEELRFAGEKDDKTFREFEKLFLDHIPLDR